MSNTRRTRCPTCWYLHTTPPGDPARRETNDAVMAAITEGVEINWRNTHALAKAVMALRVYGVPFDIAILFVWDELPLHERAVTLMSDRPDLAKLFSGVPGIYELSRENGDEVSLRVPQPSPPY